MTRIAGMALALFAGGLAGCYTSNDDAQADTSTSWLQHCTTQADCAPGAECVSGLCMLQGPEAAAEPNAAEPSAAEPSAGETNAAEPSAAEPNAAEPSAGEPSAGDTGPASGAFIALDDIVLENAMPAVGFSGDRWLVAWSSSTGGVASGYALELARVSASGEMERTSRPYRATWPVNVHLQLTADGRLAAVSSNSSCELEVFAPDLQTELFSTAIPCSGDGAPTAAAPVSGSADWLIAYGIGTYNEADQFQGSILTGRYRPDDATWLHEPVDVGAQVQEESLVVFAAGEDAVVVWGNMDGSTLRSASALAAPQPDASAPATWSDPLALAAKTAVDGGYAFATLGAQRLVFAMDGASLSAHVVGADGSVAMREIGSSTIADRQPGVAAAEELGLVGVCYARGPGPYIGGPPLEADAPLDVQGDSMWFVIVRADGTPASEPVMIADGLADNTGCGVAWSGERFLAVTWGIFQEVVDNRFTYTRIRGLLFEPPGS